MGVDVAGIENLKVTQYRADIPFRLNAIAATLASLAILIPSVTFAVEGVDEKKAEVAAVADVNDPQNAADAQQLLESDPTGAGETPAEVLIRTQRQKSIKEVHDVPVSISLVSGADLNRELAQDYNAISKRLANVTFNQSNTRGASLSIRGVGKRAFSEVQDPSVLVVQDGVSFGLTALGNFDFYDVDTVEGYRGPQGTLGGKGGSSGAVYVTTKRPSFTPESEYSVTYGQRDNVIINAATGGPVIDDLLAWRGSVVVDKGRGYYENTFDDNYTLYNKNRLSGRVQFLLTPTAEFSARLSIDVEPHAAQLQNGLAFRHDQPLLYADGSLTDPSGTTARAKLYGIADKNGTIVTPARSWFLGRDYTYYGDYVNEPLNSVNFNENQGQTVSNKGISLELDYELENHKLTSLTAWREFTFDAHNDEGTPFDINKNGGGGVFFNQYSQEFKISSKSGGAFDYQAGVIFFKTDDDIVSKTGWGSDAGAWFANTSQYNLLDRNAGVNRGAGQALLRDTLADALKRGDTWVDTQSDAIYGQGDWHWTEAATLTAGLRIGTEDRTTKDAMVITANGSGAALNPDAVRDIQLGGFASIANGNLGTNIYDKNTNTTTLVNNNSAAQLALADAVANRYYGAVITNTPGAAYASLTAAQKAQVGAAKAVRAAQFGQLYGNVKDTYDDTLYTGNLSQSYKFSDQVTAYITWQYGEKSGTGFNINGVPTGVKPEKTNAYEIGLKTFLFNETLTFNIDAFVMDIRDYQQAIRVVDQFTTDVNLAALPANASESAKNTAIAYTSTQGNVNKVQVKGIEFDGTYTGIDDITVRFSGAYNDAVYKDFKNSPKPDELTYLKDPFVDQTGNTLPGAAKFTFNLGVEYRHEVFEKAEFHTSFNTAYTTKYLNLDTLSSYSEVPAYALTDASIGLGAVNNKFDLSLVVKNLFDKRPHEKAWTTYEPYPYPRWAGITFSGKF